MTAPNVKLSSKHFRSLEREAPPAILYHYTNQAGLLNILATGELWATKVQYMNDTTEFGVAVTLARETLTLRLENAPNDETGKLYRSILDHLHAIALVNICSVSFCRSHDLLSQWRGYSGGGVGYAIGFSSDALLAIGDGCRLRHCIYEKSDQIRIINELIEDMQLQHKLHLHIDRPELFFGAAFERALIECGALFKDIAFQEEDEWRLITAVRGYNEANFSFRAGQSMPIPYYRLNIATDSWKDKIHDITIGPCPHPETSQAAVQGLLIHYHVTYESPFELPGVYNPNVQLSAIPYRSW
jgi:hypothetical protein